MVVGPIPTTVPQVAKRATAQMMGAIGTMTAEQRYGFARALQPMGGTPFSADQPGVQAFRAQLTRLNPAGAQFQQQAKDQMGSALLAQQNQLQGLSFDMQKQLQDQLEKMHDAPGQQAPPPPQDKQPPGGMDWQKWQATHSNGRISMSALVNVGGFWVAPVIADNLRALLAAAHSAGVLPAGARYATGTYRTYARQVQMYNQRHDSHGNLLPGYAQSARPGTSMHGWGLAIDFNSALPRLIAWLRANAVRFGFHNLPGEAWHYSVNGH
jgi:D-alanyl-D-alanine carboxypeptidase